MASAEVLCPVVLNPSMSHTYISTILTLVEIKNTTVTNMTRQRMFLKSKFFLRDALSSHVCHGSVFFISIKCLIE